MSCRLLLPRFRLPLLLLLLAAVPACFVRAEQEPPPRTPQEQIARWVEAGTAAGHEGDWYDNRDGQHSPLAIARYPGLKQVEYAPEEVKTIGWGLQTRVLPHITFGNSSTAGPIHHGSQPRNAYIHPLMLQVGYAQYRKNNLYIYPEHRDHDPGRNGPDGYGDLLPTNTPYLIASQGSSGSDRPFLEAVALTLAAFSPQVKARLAETGMLMPAVQQIFRQSNKMVQAEEDYFTGAAHPSVFEGSQVDVWRMIERAHAMALEDIPPLVQLQVLEEDLAAPNLDFFEAGVRSEKHADTPCAISRIFRGRTLWRKMVVSAEASSDDRDRPLSFRWVLLRGDPQRVEIRPRGERGAVAELRIAYPPRQPIAPGAALESNRVDIGVFAFNGRAWSPPSFITWFSLDNEARQYDAAGRILEIDYTTGNFADWRLTTRKDWRDEYAYADGACIGWKRTYANGRTEEYTAEGHLVIARDDDGRPSETRPVIYRLSGEGSPWQRRLEVVPLELHLDGDLQIGGR